VRGEITEAESHPGTSIFQPPIFDPANSKPANLGEAVEDFLTPLRTEAMSDESTEPLAADKPGTSFRGLEESESERRQMGGCGAASAEPKRIEPRKRRVPDQLARVGCGEGPALVTHPAHRSLAILANHAEPLRIEPKMICSPSILALPVSPRA
jgi:hypothetical protein